MRPNKVNTSKSTINFKSFMAATLSLNVHDSHHRREMTELYLALNGLVV